MQNAKNAKIQYESGDVKVPYAALTDSGDHTIFKFGSNQVVSVRDAYAAEIRPNGIVTGAKLISPAASGTDDLVDVAGFTCYIGGVLVTVTADTDITITRGGSSHIIVSLCVDSTGTITAVSGTTSTSFVATRGSAGGPPSIPTASIEIGQVRYTSSTPADVLTTDIFEGAEGGYTERYDYPIWNTDTIGEGNQATDSDKKYAFVEMVSALPVIHGSTATSAATAIKPVYAEYYTPVFADIEYADSFAPAEESFSVSSTQVYKNRTIGSSSKSLGGGGFNAYVSNGISDALSKLEGDNLTFKFYPNLNQAPYSVTQGYLGITTAYPVDAMINLSATINASKKTVKYDS